MKLKDLKRIVDLLVAEGCGECDCPTVDDTVPCFPIRWEKGSSTIAFISFDNAFEIEDSNMSDTADIDNPADRAKLVSFLKENFK